MRALVVPRARRWRRKSRDETANRHGYDHPVDEKRLKLTRVGRSLTRPEGEPIDFDIPPEKLKDPTFVARLSFRPSAKVPRAQAGLENVWKAHDHAFFIDANLASTAEGPELWSQLLQGEKRVHLIPRVFREPNGSDRFAP